MPTARRRAVKPHPLLDTVLQRLAPLGPVTGRAMFGGHGIYFEDTIFGLIAWDTLYFKADEGNRADYEALGAERFAYDSEGSTVAFPYWEVPVKVQADPKVLRAWAEKAVAAGRRAQAAKAAGRRSRSAGGAKR